MMIRASSSGVHGPLTSSGLSTFCHRCRHCTSVRLSLKYTAKRRHKIKTARQSSSLLTTARRSRPYTRAHRRSPSFSRSPSLESISRDFKTSPKKPYQSSSNSSLRTPAPPGATTHPTRRERTLVSHPPAFTHESRITQSINHAFTRSIHARVPPPYGPPILLRLLRVVSRNLKISNAHLLGRPSTLGALPRRSPDLPVRERARGRRRRRRPIRGRRARSRARAGVSPALPRRPTVAASLRRRRALFVTTVTLGVRDIARANARRYRSSRRRSSSTARHDDALVARRPVVPSSRGMG